MPEEESCLVAVLMTYIELIQLGEEGLCITQLFKNCMIYNSVVPESAEWLFMLVNVDMEIHIWGSFFSVLWLLYFSPTSDMSE